MVVLLAAWVAAGAIVLLSWLLGLRLIPPQWPMELRSWLLDQWARVGTVGIVVSALAAFYMMLVIHELGHVVAGLCAGFRWRSLRIGPLLFKGPFQVSLYRGPGAVVNGVAELSPIASDNLAIRGVVMVLGGPVANLLSAFVVLLLPIPIGIFPCLFILLSLVNGVHDLVPFESRLGVSDGRRIWMLTRQHERGERWLALLHLGVQLHDGVPFESLSSDFLAKAIAVRDDSVDTVTAHAIAYSAAFHQHADDVAAHRLETCLAHSGRAAPAVRDALMSDAAVFQARRRNRADLAEHWLAKIPAGAQQAWLRSRAEAAIMEARGDTSGALGKLAGVEAAILAFPQGAMREVLLRSVRKWRSELGARADGGGP